MPLPSGWISVLRDGWDGPMRDRGTLLDHACEAMIAGDAQRCEAALDRFRASVERRPLAEEERARCAAQLDRLRELALAACSGIESARSWLAELARTTAGLDVYDRSGRQRVSTGLTNQAKRF